MTRTHPLISMFSYLSCSIYVAPRNCYRISKILLCVWIQIMHFFRLPDVFIFPTLSTGYFYNIFSILLIDYIQFQNSGIVCSTTLSNPDYLTLLLGQNWHKTISQKLHQNNLEYCLFSDVARFQSLFSFDHKSERPHFRQGQKSDFYNTREKPY